jgi:chemotaxis signal transduction protein
MASQQFCTFLLDGHLFGVPVPQVQEVIRFHPMTRCPWRRRRSKD